MSTDFHFVHSLPQGNRSGSIGLAIRSNMAKLAVQFMTAMRGCSMKIKAGAILSSIRIDQKSGPQDQRAALHGAARHHFVWRAQWRGAVAGNPDPGFRGGSFANNGARCGGPSHFRRVAGIAHRRRHLRQPHDDPCAHPSSRKLARIDARAPRLSPSTVQCADVCRPQAAAAQVPGFRHGACPLCNAFPMAQWARLSARHLRSDRDAVMGYGNPYGLPRLAGSDRHLISMPAGGSSAILNRSSWSAVRNRRSR
jgi:hypothetical protein